MHPAAVLGPRTSTSAVVRSSPLVMALPGTAQRWCFWRTLCREKIRGGWQRLGGRLSEGKEAKRALGRRQPWASPRRDRERKLLSLSSEGESSARAL
jgi:hypothetical protein